MSIANASEANPVTTTATTNANADAAATTTDAAPPPPAKKKSLLRRLCHAATVFTLTLIALGTVAGGVALYGYYLIHKQPEHWVQNRERLDNMTRREKAVAAGNVEKLFLAQLSESSASGVALGGDGRPLVQAVLFTPPDPATHEAKPIANPFDQPAGHGESDIKLSVQDTNVWFDQRFDNWLGSQGVSLPEQVSEFMVTAKEGKPIVSFEMRYEDTQRGVEVGTVVSMALETRFYDDGRMSLRIGEVQGGALPLPFEEIVGQLTERFSDRLDDEHLSFLDHVMEGTPFHPTVKVDKVRVRRLVGLDVKGEEIAMRFRTEFKKGYQPKPEELEALQNQSTANAER